ncbi:MAG: hypothetical protein AAB857_01500 [Patescibacteria group bacterium]
MRPYKNFQKRFKLLIQKDKRFIETPLSNIFTMRLVGNKTHGDLAEIGIAEFINQYMYDFKSIHVGKDLYRAKKHEEDIVVINKLNGEKFPLSLKAYGDGPLQLSTDKESKMFSYLEKISKKLIQDKKTIASIFDSENFIDFSSINVLPLIYNEKKKKCNIMIFDSEKAKEQTAKILKITKGKGRMHPAYIFQNEKDEYICEVRYGGKSANALQRGLWTNTKRAVSFFDSLTNGWIEYKDNLSLVKLISIALNATYVGHDKANEILQKDIDNLKKI